MRLMTLNEMLAELRLEARLSADVAHGSHLVNRYIGLLRRTQEEVYHGYEWPNLKITQTTTVQAGQRYVTYPAAFDFEGINRVFQKGADGDWTELAYGINADDLNQIDSDANEQRDNIERWQNYLSLDAEQVNTNMMEVWPLPSREITLRFEGKRKLLPLQDQNTDRSTVDGIIVVLHAAAEILAGQKAEDAPLKLQKAQQRFDLMRQRTSNPNNNRIVPNSGGRFYNPQRFRTR